MSKGAMVQAEIVGTLRVAIEQGGSLDLRPDGRNGNGSALATALSLVSANSEPAQPWARMLTALLAETLIVANLTAARGVIEGEWDDAETSLGSAVEVLRAIRQSIEEEMSS